MNIQLEAFFTSSYVFQPIYTLTGKLLAVELLSRFNSPSGNLSMSPDILIGLLRREQKAELLMEQITLVEACADWFYQHAISLTINLDEDMVDIILTDINCCRRLQNLGFIAFEISESFPGLSLGRRNVKIAALSRHFPLWLDDFGSGKSNLAALYDGLFTYVKIDKHFFWRLSDQPSYDAVLSSVLKNVNPLCKGIVIAGIEEDRYLNRLYDADILGVQGFLWPNVAVTELERLLGWSISGTVINRL